MSEEQGKQVGISGPGESNLGSRGRVWLMCEKVLMEIFWYFDHQLRVLNKV